MQAMTIPTREATLDRHADLETILSAWHGATARLQQTHEALRSEVRRLSDELEIKNRELARKNRLADLGRIASHIAHEVRNNLVPVKLYLSLLRRRLAEDGNSLEIVEKVAAGFTALDATVEDLLHFAADRDPQWETFPIRPLVDDVYQSLAPQLAAQDIDVAIDVPGELTLSADRNMVRRAALNIVLNALDSMPGGGQLVITAHASATGVDVEIADSGAGLADESKRRLFEPFFTTKSGGTGLGLAIVDHIAQVHGGAVSAANCPEGGAAFTLHFPRRTRPEAHAA
jgi:signal transduction histidine kinase